LAAAAGCGPLIRFSSGRALEDVWFDTINIIPFSENNLSLYVNLASEIDDWTQYIVDNQMGWAENCGKVYLPGRLLVQQKVYNVEYKCKVDEFRDLLDDLRPTLDDIVKRMYINPGRASSVFFFFGTEKALPKLLTKFNRWRSATISISPKHSDAPPVKSEIRTFDDEVRFEPPNRD
jgi:DNA-dependent RNA polymerase auxiliary subunit epsilon